MKIRQANQIPSNNKCNNILSRYNEQHKMNNYSCLVDNITSICINLIHLIIHLQQLVLLLVIRIHWIAALIYNNSHCYRHSELYYI